MLTTKKWRRRFQCLVPVAAPIGSLPIALVWVTAIFLVGCRPSGPEVLKTGAELVQQGNYPEALQKLELAAELMPQNAQAWNHLGLACQYSGRTDDAIQAYEQAIKRDRNLAAPRFNLGFLQLERHQLTAATDALAAYCVLQPQSLEGWLRLGTAQLRGQKIADAEKSFGQALKLSPQQAEALNGLGIVHSQRKRAKEAAQCFNGALASRSNYPPALLNLAVVLHQQPNNRLLALQKYRDYLALRPAPANREAVQRTERALEAELFPPTRPALTNALLQTAPGWRPISPQTNSAATAAKPQISAPAPASSASTNRPAPLLAAAPTKTNAQPNATPPVQPAPDKTPAAPPVEVVRLPDEPLLKPTQDVLPTAPAKSSNQPAGIAPAANPAAKGPTPQTSSDQTATSNRSPATSADKPGIFQRLNPATWFRSKPKSEPMPTPLATIPGLPAGPIAATNASSTATHPQLPPASPQLSPPPPRPQPVHARYAYRSPGKPAAGNRAEASRFFAQGMQEQRQRRSGVAMAAYLEAVRLDASFFEAQHNLGLAAYEAGDLPKSLTAYEHALAIQPGSVDARYNFALALQQAKYPLDAARELETILAAAPNDTRALLILAQLYARQLNQPQLARQHYLKVLQADPRHAQASAIRNWLAANP